MTRPTRTLAFLAMTLTGAQAAAQDIGGAFIGSAIGNAGIEAATAPLETEVTAEPSTPLDDATAVRARFGYSVSQSVRRTTAAKLAKELGANAADRSLLQAQFASNAFYDQVERGLAPFGLDPRNLVDAYAFWWINVWDAAQGRNSNTTKAQATAVRNQVLRALAGARNSFDDADKQRISEEFIVHGVVFADQLETFASDRQVIGQIRNAARQAGVRITGLDPLHLKLTDAGFQIIRND